DQALCARAVTSNGVCEAVRGKFEQRGLYVLRRLASLDHFLQPAVVEKVPAGAFRRCCRKIGFLQHALKQAGKAASGSRPGAAGVVRRAQMARCPEIEQAVPRTAVEAEDVAMAWQEGQVGDAAKIHCDPVFRRIREYRRVEGG